MPFTFSHPAIVLPLNSFAKKWVSFTALIIGSIVPDFEYFLRMKVKSLYSHTLWGTLWFDLPLGILLAFLFHNIVRNILFQNLPRFFQERLTGYQHFKWNNYFARHWFLIIVSFLIGIASHLLWDGFTHSGGYFVHYFPSLMHGFKTGNIIIPFYKYAQHLSSLLGAVIIVVAFWEMKPRKIQPRKISSPYWLIFAVVSTVILITRILLLQNWLIFAVVSTVILITRILLLQKIMIGTIVVSAIASLFVGLIISSIIFTTGKNRAEYDK